MILGFKPTLGAEVLRSPYTKKEREELFLRCPVCDGTVSEETPIFVSF
jgi:hypothetical protein